MGFGWVVSATGGLDEVGDNLNVMISFAPRRVRLAVLER
jgi:hypothetical protein